MLRYSYFLFSHARVNKGLYLSFVISLIVTVVLFALSVTTQNNAYEGYSINIKSGLVSEFYLKMVLFILWGITTAYFVSFISRADHKEGFELQIISKKLTRVQIHLSKVFVSVAFCFFWATVNSIFLLIPLFMDEIFTTDQKVRWFFSIYLGSLIIGLIIVSVVSSISIIMSHSFSIIVSVLFILFFPLLSIFMWFAKSPDSRIINERHSRGDLGINYQLNKIDNKIAKNGKLLIHNNKLVYEDIKTTSTFETIYAKPNDLIDKEISDYNKSNKFKDYSSKDIWNPFSNYLSMFLGGDSSYDHSYQSFSKGQLFIKDIESGNTFINEGNSIKFDMTTYVYIPKKNSSSEEINFFVNPYMEVSGSKKNESYVEDLYESFKTFITSNYSYSEFYKHLSFLEQCKLMERYINHFDKNVDKITDFFFPTAIGQSNIVRTRVLEKDANNQIGGFIFANRLIREMSTYKPAHFSDGLSSYDPFISNIYPDSNLFYEINNLNYDNKSVGIYIWPPIMLALVAASILLYRKKDVK